MGSRRFAKDHTLFYPLACVYVRLINIIYLSSACVVEKAYVCVFVWVVLCIVRQSVSCTCFLVIRPIDRLRRTVFRAVLVSVSIYGVAGQRRFVIIVEVKSFPD